MNTRVQPTRSRPTLARIAWLRCVVALGAGLGGGAGGCATNPTDTPTRGWALSLRVSQSEGNRYLYYELERGGKLMYVAGERAKLADPSESTPTWSGVLTAAEAAPIAAHLESDREPTDAEKSPGGTNYRATLRPPTGWNTDIDSGPTPFLDRLLALLNEAQRARRPGVFDPFPK
ncbi:MAG: hypothetical protein ACKVS8_14380 [Phycisphaerales bacterium]